MHFGEVTFTSLQLQRILYLITYAYCVNQIPVICDAESGHKIYIFLIAKTFPMFIHKKCLCEYNV